MTHGSVPIALPCIPTLLRRVLMGAALITVVAHGAFQAAAFDKGGLQSGAPIEVTADKELEWDREGKTYVARGSAKATQGQNALEGDVLKAYYDEGDDASNTKINRIEAYGHVVIRSESNTAYGDVGVYDLKTGEAVLTGKNLILASPAETITARDKITFNSRTNTMTAEGRARVEHENDVLESDRLVATFHEVDGRLALKQVEAIGNVTITTPNEKLSGERGLYIAATNIATIEGNVRITRAGNTLTGAKGMVDLNTRKSRLYGGSGLIQDSGAAAKPQADGNGRVKGVFYPE